MSTIDTAKVLLDERGQLLTKLSTERLKLIAQRDAATKAAHELAQMLPLEQLQKTSKSTAEWLAEHFRLAGCEE